MYVRTFPALNASMTTDPQDVVTASTTESSNTPQPCKCPRRTLPPKQPTPPPFPICEENRARLEEHLLQVHASSAFNTCEHQPLPIMSGKPLRLMIAPDATPTAHHKPIPVPLHWQEEVKAGLDRDMRLGVLEKVPVGTAVTWCHHMIICPKKNGSLRRTIDFQATQPGKHTTLSPPSTRLVQFLNTPRRRCSMPGMGITPWHWTLLIAISRRS